jgi:hypothetical protein
MTYIAVVVAVFLGIIGFGFGSGAINLWLLAALLLLL